MNPVATPDSAFNRSAPAVIALAPKSPRRRNLVSLTPLIDVVFILLIFFMLASNFLEWRELKFSATVAEYSGPGSGEGLHVALGRDGNVVLDGRVVALNTLCQLLEERLRGEPDVTVMVEPKEGVSVQEMVSLVDRLVAAGVTQLSFVTLPAGDSDWAALPARSSHSRDGGFRRQSRPPESRWRTP